MAVVVVKMCNGRGSGVGWWWLECGSGRGSGVVVVMDLGRAKEVRGGAGIIYGVRGTVGVNGVVLSIAAATN